MGYYSDVKIRCQKEAFRKIMDAVINTNSLDIVEVCIDTDGLFTLYWNYTKWYTTFPRVAQVTQVLDELDMALDPVTDDLGYYMVRVGESYEDIETRQNNYDYPLDVLIDIDIPARSYQMSLDDIRAALNDSGEPETTDKENTEIELNDISAFLFDD